MITTTSNHSQTQSYTCRLATVEDASAIAPLWKAFAEERESIDPSMLIQPNFNFEYYITRLLEKPLSFCWVLEHYQSIIGCLFTYFYNEKPPQILPQTMQEEYNLDHPFVPRRVGSVLGLYVQPEHRQAQGIQLLAEAAITQAEELKVTDIDLMIAADQTGVQALLQRAGFTKSAVQYTRHYDLAPDQELPSLHPPTPELLDVELPTPGAIPLRDPETQELIRNSQGEIVFLIPLTNDQKELIKTTTGSPIYPTPLRDTATNQWVFDQNGHLVVCPPVYDELGKVVEYQGIPQFHLPAYEFVDGVIRLKRDDFGRYRFCDVERDSQGYVLRTPDGQLIFKPATALN